LQHGDVTENLNIGIFFEAAPWKDPEYYSFLILQRLLGDKPETELELEMIGG
jgi:processing peptidase subunit alpha/processing peptidase subunit beta